MIRIVTEWTSFQGAPYYSTMFFEGAVLADAQAASTAVHTFWGAIADRINTDTDWVVQDEVARVDPANGNVLEMFSAGDKAGSGASAVEPLPWTTQGLIQWRTGVYQGGRQIRGRTFVPGATEAFNGVGRPTQPYIDDLQAAADALVGTSDLGVWSRASGQFVLGATATVWDQWAVLRSRRA